MNCTPAEVHRAGQVIMYPDLDRHTELGLTHPRPRLADHVAYKLCVKATILLIE